MPVDPETARRPGGGEHLADRPFLPGFGIPAHGGHGEAVGGQVEGRMRGDELTLEVRGELRHDEAVVGEKAPDLVDIGLAFGRLLDVDDAAVPCRQLHADEALPFGPARQPREAVVGGVVARELREEDAGALDGSHVSERPTLLVMARERFRVFARCELLGMISPLYIRPDPRPATFIALN